MVWADELIVEGGLSSKLLLALGMLVLDAVSKWNESVVHNDSDGP